MSDSTERRLERLEANTDPVPRGDFTCRMIDDAGNVYRCRPSEGEKYGLHIPPLTEIDGQGTADRDNDPGIDFLYYMLNEVGKAAKERTNDR